MINCGGSINLYSSLIDLKSHVRIYILDRHRPYHLSNVYSEEQIRLFESPFENKVIYPEYEDGDDNEVDYDVEDEPAGDEEEEDIEDIGPGGRNYEDEEDEYEDGDDTASQASRRADGSEGLTSDGSPSTKRRKRNKNEIRTERQEIRRHERAMRLERNRIAENYYQQVSSDTVASSYLMFALAVVRRQVSNSELWLGMIGVSDMYAFDRLEEVHYTSLVHGFNSELRTPQAQLVEQLRARSRESGQHVKDALVMPVGYVKEYQEYRAPLMMHWSVYAALEQSAYTAARMQTWTDAGRTRLESLLAHLGIKWADAQQLYKVMTTREKKEIKNSLEDKAAEPMFDIPKLRFPNWARVS